MKAIRVHEPGELDMLKVEEVASPQMKPGHIRIGVRACGINFADILIVKGLYQEKPPMPFTPGGEVAGEVLEVAPDVKGIKPGDRVMSMIGTGGLAEEALVAADMALPIPKSVSFEAAAAFSVAYGTSHVALAHRAGLKSGETLLVHGAAGGVGLTAVEIGKLMGATVIAVASTREKLDVAKSKGADHLINSKTENLRERVKEITNGRGADVIYDPVGGASFDQSLRCIAFEGRIIVIGFASGTIPQIPANLLLVKNISVVGLYWGSYAKKRPEILMGSMHQLMTWLGEGKITPHISHAEPLSNAVEALRALEERRSTGKVVVTMGAD
ncbi:NADPH:quinone oxidoreductase [Iodidimonas muriae]|uniref:NADPH:quinone oxidoreductase n=1 Tax=Iodidimonas muriae TaxID=261467 RepID=A0ABQ2LEZ2_9PROT|nr:NADPH:quinone oxidoreductase family protein [Iodidimonas muriae]GER07476.1 NADPH:quinone oxidoreductase [Kordiimonadales bacterium JCM 17843]GGO14348.1 NADPH:quinone oxidoreductase [Iodidimonas muriae]